MIPEKNVKELRQALHLAGAELEAGQEKKKTLEGKRQGYENDVATLKEEARKAEEKYFTFLEALVSGDIAPGELAGAKKAFQSASQSLKDVEDLLSATGRTIKTAQENLPRLQNNFTVARRGLISQMYADFRGDLRGASADNVTRAYALFSLLNGTSGLTYPACLTDIFNLDEVKIREFQAELLKELA